MKIPFSWIVAGILLTSCTTVGLAQQQAPAAAPSATTAAKPAAMSDDAKKAKAKECSKQADAKKLHGEARREFRAKCKRS